MAQMNQKQLMQYINEVSFGIDELALFLDTHPMDQKALDYYEHLRVLRKKAVDAYTKHFGPLTYRDGETSDYWTWVQTPWPWEMEG